MEQKKLTPISPICLLLFGAFISGGRYLFAVPIPHIEGLKNQRTYVIETANKNEAPVSFHFLMPTIGRRCIFRALDSLALQVKPQDYLTIIFDAKDVDHVFQQVKEKLSSFNCKTNLIFESTNLGFWGHGIRNKYNKLPGDFILHCDDDNKYLPNSISMIRKLCDDTSKLYIFKVKICGGIAWSTPSVALGNIDTACGIVPAQYNSLSTWQPVYGGDFRFYESLVKNLKNSDVVFVDYVIYNLCLGRSRSWFER